MKSAVAFSLWGDDPKYTQGMLENCRLIKKYYPEFETIIYVNNSIRPWVVDGLKKQGAQIRKGYSDLMFWRFEAAEEYDVMLSRDADSRISQREVDSVRTWLKTSKPFHVMRDHPHHNQPMMGGMWGVQLNGLRQIKKLIRSWTGPLINYNDDQNFLKQKVWPIALEKGVFQHDLCYHRQYGAESWPAKIGEWRFVGEVFDAEGNPRDWDWQMRVNWLI